MEFFLVSMVVSFAFLISVSIRYLFYPPNSNVSSHKLPPGKMGLPLLGESLQFLSAGWKGQPEKFFQDRMSKYASNVFKTSLLGDSTIVMCGADANKFLFTNENKLVAAWYPESFKKIFTSATEDGSAKRARKLMSDLTKREGLQGYIGVMDTIAQRHFASDWEGKQEVSVSPLAKSFTFLLACKLFLSMEDTNLVARLASPFYDVLSGIFSIPIDIPGTAFNRAIKASKLIKKQLRSIIMQRKIDLAQKKASPTQDILSLMLMTIDENGQHIKESGIASQILGFLLAGHDTTSSAITSIVMYLAELPEIYENVYKEQSEIAYSKKPGESLNWDDIQRMKYSWSVACEAMRLAPPSLGGFRVALNDFIFQDFCIPKGWKLFWSSYATHTNSEYFSIAKEFDPSRFQGHGSTPYTFVPFGGGSRICPGKEYARLGILVFMHHMVKRFKWKKFILDEKLGVDPSPRPTKGLPIRLILHQVKV